MVIGPIRLIFSSTVWKTKTVLYQNKYNAKKTIEFQRRDVGALGYRKRTVEVHNFTNLFMVVKPLSKDLDENKEWIKVN